MNPNEIDQFLRLNGGENEFQEPFLGPSKGTRVDYSRTHRSTSPGIIPTSGCKWVRFGSENLARTQPEAHAATPAPQYSNAVPGVPHYANAVPGAHPTTTVTMTAHPQPNLRIQPQVVSLIGNAHGGQMLPGFGNQYAGESVRFLPPGSAVRMVANPGGAFAALQPAPQNATNGSTYSVFVHSTTHEIEKFNSAKAPANDLNKSTLRIFSTDDIGWPASLDHYTWDSFVPAAFDMLGKTRQYLGEHLHHLFGEGELAFQFSLFRHSTYGGMSNFFIKSDDRFQEFAATARADPSSRLTIAITMKDPRKIIKQNDVLESGNLELELMYAPEKQKVIKAKRQARLAVNPKADLDAVHENSRVEELASNILAKYGCNAETMRIKDPLDPKKSIAIHSQALRAWSRVWVAGVPGVDINTPPRTRQFEPEDIRVYTLAEEAVRRGGRRVPKSPDPFDLSVNKTPAAQGPKFGPVRTSSGGRVMPNKSQGPQSAPAKTVARADTTPPNNGANRHSRTASPLVDFLFSDDLPETRPSSPEEERSEAVDELSTTAAGDSDIDDEDGQSAGDRRSGPDGRTTSLGDTSVSSTVERTARRESSEIEHRLTFGGSRPASRLPSISPTRKRPGSDRSSNQLVGGTSSKSTRGTGHQPPIMAPPVLDKPPLNDLGLAMTLDEFIEHCNLGDLASVAHGLIKLNHISHWDFFYRNVTAEQLQLLSFPYALARELLKGAEQLEVTHVKSLGDK
ncbi:hypothetical protein PSHT_10320 [Puccinia striiformis]|uniref:Uncharacterized protein n=1 Tax=Puccinia striiformis TaxID=27350 RepID=A0A2S4VAD4_9BASI|nr:hypothetical protein PSHT_10320 [Puccinia striiformis]